MMIFSRPGNWSLNVRVFPKKGLRRASRLGHPLSSQRLAPRRCSTLLVVVGSRTWLPSARVRRHTHINKLELLATLSTVKWRLRSSKQQRCRLLHLVDSQVVGAIVTKGRTSSLVLRSTIQKLSALLIAGCVYPSYLYVASEDNPADLPSRWQWVGKFRRPGLKLRPSDRGCAKPKRR